MNDILNANEAARVIGCAPQKVREMLKRKIWTFGEVVLPEKTGKVQIQYEINKYALARYLGIDVEEANRRLGR